MKPEVTILHNTQGTSDKVYILTIKDCIIQNRAGYILDVAYGRRTAETLIKETLSCEFFDESGGSLSLRKKEILANLREAAQKKINEKLKKGYIVVSGLINIPSLGGVINKNGLVNNEVKPKKAKSKVKTVFFRKLRVVI